MAETNIISKPRCSKHEPVRADGLLERLRGDVQCARCGRKGCYSRGQRKFGRPPRIIWFRAEEAAGAVPE